METIAQAAAVQPGEGDQFWLVGDTYTIKVSGAQNGGAFALLEAEVAPDAGPPPHIHHREDETFVVLEGELDFFLEAETIEAGAGAVVYVPKGTRHSYANVGTRPAKMLFLYTPAGMDEMFTEIGTPARPGLPAPRPSEEDVAKLLDVAPKYGFEILLPSVS